MKEREEVDRRGPLLTLANFGGLVIVIMVPDRVALSVAMLIVIVLSSITRGSPSSSSWRYRQFGIQVVMAIVAAVKFGQAYAEIHQDTNFDDTGLLFPEAVHTSITLLGVALS